MPSVVHAMPWGFLLAEEQGDALTRVQYLRPEEREAVSGTGSSPLLREACAQLDAYFAGRLRRFDLPLSPQGTEFQRRIWEELGRIGWGCTRSYGEVARAVGSPHGLQPQPSAHRRSLPPRRGGGRKPRGIR